MWYLLAVAAGAGHVVLYPDPLPSGVLLLGGLLCVAGRVLFPMVLRFVPLRGLGASMVLASYCLMGSALFLMGSALGSWQLNQLWSGQLAVQYTGVPQNLSFYIDSLPTQRNANHTFFARVVQVHCGANNCLELKNCPELTNCPELKNCPEPKSCPDLAGKRVRLTWRNPSSVPLPGQTWRAQVRLQPPRGFINPGGFDYHGWLLGQRVAATGQVINSENPHLLDEVANLASRRQGLREDLLKADRQFQFASIFAALLVGDRSGLEPSAWQVLQSTGTIHLMAISGLHIGLAAFWGYLIGAGLARVCGLLIPGPGAAWLRILPPLCSCSAALGYAALAGFAIPTVRALIACLLANGCLLLGLRIRAGTLLALGLLLVTVAEPLAWLHQGFWLSFLAVAVLLYTLRGRSHPVWGLVKAQLALSIGLLVPLLALGQWVSLTSPVANLVAVPVVSVIIVPGLLFAALVSPVASSVSHGMLWGLDWLFQWLWLLLQWLATVPHTAWWPAQSLTLWAAGAGAAGVLLLCAPRALPVQGLGALLLVVCLWGQARTSPELRVTVLDVGQGLAVVVELPGETWVYDTGPGFSEQFDAGSGIVAPYLRRQGVRQISLILSRAAPGSGGGAEGLATTVSIDQLLYGQAPILEREGAPCHAGQNWQQGNVRWQVLWPPESGGNGGDKREDDHNSACVVLLTLERAEGPVHILLPGDIDRAAERQLLSALPTGVDLLVAPHHGSATSSSALFVERLQARHVVFSTAHNNLNRFPNPEVVARYLGKGAQIHNTAEHGAVVVSWYPGASAVITRSREHRPRLWYRNNEASDIY